MIDSPVILPATRSWRDIPQQVTPRAMSPEGRRRRWMQVGGVVGLLLTLAATAWAAWEVSRAMRSGPHGVAVAEPIGDRIRLFTDGVLDRGWLVRTLALPRDATLMTIDIAQLRSRLLADGQVAAADITRTFPATLAVHLSERSPVARIRAAAADGSVRELLAARDGTVYEGHGYDPAMLRTLPWLDGIRLARADGGFSRIEGMGSVADLLSRSKLEAEHLYSTWRVVSLARLSSDGEITVRTADGLAIIFGTREDFYRQLARLDLLLDTIAKADARARQQAADGTAAPVAAPVPRVINLSLGSQVPVSFAPAPPAAGADSAAPQFHIQLPP